MNSKPIIDVIIPAFNEENAVGNVVAEIPSDLVRDIVVVNNNSTDKTAAVAKQAGATVIDQPQKGYGNACLKGMAYIEQKNVLPDVVVFLDADYSDYPEEMSFLVEPIVEHEIDMVIGSRSLGNREKGAMTPQQIFGNWLATFLLKLLYKVEYTDLGPFRAIKYSSLIDLGMRDKTYGWTVEMQLKAAKQKMRTCEVPVNYRNRIGFSKVSGTVKGTIGAGYKIITTIFKYFIVELVLIIIYTLALSFIFLYSIIQINLVYNYLTKRKRTSFVNRSNSDLPFVTVQLPLYNELYVVERLIDAVAKLDYPKDKFEIQLLDDSNDETLNIVARKVTEYKEKGFQIYQYKRRDRTGYKAGALVEGTKKAKGEFIAIFDADFLPNPQFLKETIPYFQDEKIGVVQTRWEHINKNYSLLTRLQAFGLDAHFTVEQTGRNVGNHFINFNGTAGVWRKSCIEDAGGWQSDTLTEDLDLSYRAQLKGVEV